MRVRDNADFKHVLKKKVEDFSYILQLHELFHLLLGVARSTVVKLQTFAFGVRTLEMMFQQKYKHNGTLGRHLVRAITTCFDQSFNNEAVFSCVTMILLARLLTDPLWLPFNGIFPIAVGISQFSIDRFFEKPENKLNSRPERSFVSSDMVTKMNLCANHVRQNNLEKNQRGKYF